MITTLTVENWKSIENATLNIDPLTVVIGTNSSGKSNLLDALVFLNRISTGLMLTAALQGDSTISPLRGGVEWAARKPQNDFALAVTIRSSDSTDYQYRLQCRTTDNRCELVSEQLDRLRYRLSRKDDKRIGEARRIALVRLDALSVDDSHSIIGRLYNEKAGTKRSFSRNHSAVFQLVGQKLRQEIQEGVDAVNHALRNVFILDPIPSHMRTYSQLSDRLEGDAGNIAGVLAALSDDRRLEIETTLAKYASRLPERDIGKVYSEAVGKFQTDAMLYCEEHLGADGSTQIVDARGMSDGTLRFLAILTALLTRPEGSLLVIEEVDNGLHPSRSQLLLEMLRDQGASRSVDVIVTTHNPALLDAMGTKMVPFITVAHRDPISGASQLTLLEDIHLLPKLLAQGPVGRMSSQGLIEKALNDQLGAEA